MYSVESAVAQNLFSCSSLVNVGIGFFIVFDAARQHAVQRREVLRGEEVGSPYPGTVLYRVMATPAGSSV